MSKIGPRKTISITTVVTSPEEEAQLERIFQLFADKVSPENLPVFVKLLERPNADRDFTALIKLADKPFIKSFLPK